jgi:thiamine biosynthesis protein ThiS
MRILLNGLNRDFPDGQTLRELLESLGLSPERVAVERNGAIVPRDRYADSVLAEGDRLEVVQFVGGG